MDSPVICLQSYSCPTQSPSHFIFLHCPGSRGGKRSRRGRARIYEGYGCHQLV